MNGAHEIVPKIFKKVYMIGVAFEIRGENEKYLTDNTKLIR